MFTEDEGIAVGVICKGGQRHSGNDMWSSIKIVSGMSWRQMRPPLLLQGDYKEEFIEECKDLGELAAAGLEAGIF